MDGNQFSKLPLIEIDKDFAIAMGWLVYWDKKGAYELGPNLSTRFHNNSFVTTDPVKKYFGTAAGKPATLYWDVHGKHLELSSKVNWIFHNVNTAYRRIVGTRNRTLHIYSDAAGSSVVGQTTTDLLREIEYMTDGRGTRYFEPMHIHYIPIRVNTMETIKVQVSETSGALVPFNNKNQIPTIVTLHFRKRPV